MGELGYVIITVRKLLYSTVNVMNAG